MNVHKLFTDDRAVSPVVGVALLIAITVILAAVIGGVVLGLGTSSAEAPQASLQFEYDDGENDLTIHHQGGDKLNADHIEVRSGANTADLNDDLSAGGSDTVDIAIDGERINVVWMDPNSNDETVLGTYRA